MKNINETKEELLDALQDKKVLRCPYCKCKVFTRKSLQRVEMIDNGESIEDSEVDSYIDYSYECANCGEDVTEKELR